MATALMVCALVAIVAHVPLSIHNGQDVVVLVVLSVFAYATGDYALPAFQIDVGLVLALAAIILTGPIGALVVLVIPELLRPWVTRQHVRRIATVANLVSIAWMVLAAQAVLGALATAHPSFLGRLIIYVPVAIVMVLVNFLLTRGIVAGLVDRTLISRRRDELRALGACLALAPFAVLTAGLLPTFGVLALVAAALAELVLGCLVRLLTWTPPAAGLSVPEARARYAAALAAPLALSRSQRRAVLAAARFGADTPRWALRRAGDRDRVAKTLLLAGLWPGGGECFARLRPAEMGIESRVLLVAHGWAELTASGTEQLEHRLALLTLHNNPRRYDRRIVAAARELALESTPDPRSTRIPLARTLSRRLAHLKLAT